ARDTVDEDREEKPTINSDGKANGEVKKSKGAAAAEVIVKAQGPERMTNLRTKFEKSESEDVEHTSAVKRPPTKVKYAGINSAKFRLMEEVNKSSASEATAGPPKQRSITPPRAGVATGVLESQPQARLEGVIGADDQLEQVDLTRLGEHTRTLRAKFKKMEETGGQVQLQINNKN
ncbi:unnamed protein product, partial [Protopolystoma xenopodis]